MLFSALKPIVICYSGNKKLIYLQIFFLLFVLLIELIFIQDAQLISSFAGLLSSQMWPCNCVLVNVI